MKELEKLLEQKKAVIGVIGLGYVGLPLSCLFSNKGFRVLGADLKREAVEKIRRGKSPINEPGLQEILEISIKNGNLKVSTDGGSIVNQSDIVFVVVQTPIDDNNEPDLSAFISAWQTVSENVRKGQLLISESTVPPGTMKEIVLPMFENKGLEPGEDFYLAYSPERAIPTRTLEEMQRNDRVVGGITGESTDLAAKTYSQITTGEISKTDVETAEMVKVAENAYRDVNIAFANELALLCEKRGVDASRAIEIANKHPRVNILNPGPGVGGHCIPKDPHFLIHSAKKSGLELKLISTARKINESMPKHIIGLIKKSLKEVNKDPRTAKISILGIAYKGNTDDSRNSPAEPIVKELMADNCDVISHDPYVTQDFGGKFSNHLDKVVRKSDCVVFVADHDFYKTLDVKKFKSRLNRPCVVIDSRRIFGPDSFPREKGINYIPFGG